MTDQNKAEEEKTHEHLPIPIQLYEKMRQVASSVGEAPQRYLWSLIESDYMRWKKENQNK
ncbi:MAG: hypothetical protein VXY34_05380 [Bdellovibrionota bacterium]|nr:hypothetical protein [Bdellovibrionota bacterium]MEC8624231.1 hypothetical protein [Bdellovibrionota bacterium]